MSNTPTNPSNAPKPDNKNARPADDKRDDKQQQGQTAHPAPQQQGSPTDTRQPGGSTEKK